MTLTDDRLTIPVMSGGADPADITGPAAISETSQTAEAADTAEVAEAAVLDLVAIGQRLREVRHRYGWTRSEVEELSGGRWSATALGTYERGERMMSAAAFAALADFYRAPSAALLSTPEIAPLPARSSSQLVVIDSRRLALTTQWPLLQSFVTNLRQVRGARRRRLVPLRTRELPRLAAVHELSVDEFLHRLEGDGLRAQRRR